MRKKKMHNTPIPRILPRVKGGIDKKAARFRQADHMHMVCAQQGDGFLFHDFLHC